MVEFESGHATSDAFGARMLEAMVANAWDPIVAIDVDDEIQFFNAAAEELFGYDAEEVLGKSAHGLLAPEKYDDDIQAGMETFRETGDGPILGGTRELDAMTRDGSIIPVELTVNPFEVGGERFAVAVIRDVSTRKALESAVDEHREWAERYFELAGTVMVELDIDGTIVRINDRGIDLLGYEEETLVGANWFETVTPPENDLSAEEVIRQLCETDGSVEIHENQILTRDGDHRTLKWHNTLLRDREGEVTGILSAGTDMTTQRLHEKKLRLQNERLEEFASVVSHDLRNPLNVAEGRLDLAREECDSDHLEDVDGALSRMHALIDDLLTLAREGDHVDEREDVSLATLAEECWGNVETGDATLRIETDLTIQADRSRLAQIFENLLRNAVEHGGETVTVTVDADENCFFVADDGPGIPADQRDSVFDAGFSTAESGTGFGLAIVRQVAEAHGWDVRVGESADGGARFEFHCDDFVR